MGVRIQPAPLHGARLHMREETFKRREAQQRKHESQGGEVVAHVGHITQLEVGAAPVHELL